MIEFIKNNILSICALLISLASFALSFKNYLKSNIKLKLSSNQNKNICVGFFWYEEYKLIIVDLTIENDSNTSVDISRIKLVNNNNSYLAKTISIEDSYNPNGISLINENEDEYITYDISSSNILNKTRIDSYGTSNGLAVFSDIELITSPTQYKIIVDTPSKSFYTNVTVNLCPEGFYPIHPLED